MNWAMRLEHKRQDAWIGAYWERKRRANPAFIATSAAVAERHLLDIWICIVPCWPIHIWSYPERPKRKRRTLELPYDLKRATTVGVCGNCGHFEEQHGTGDGACLKCPVCDGYQGVILTTE